MVLWGGSLEGPAEALNQLEVHARRGRVEGVNEVRNGRRGWCRVKEWQGCKVEGVNQGIKATLMLDGGLAKEAS